MEQISTRTVCSDFSPNAQSTHLQCCGSGRARRRVRCKYIFTDQIDQLIREIYLNHRDAKTGFGIRPQEGRHAALGAQEACSGIRPVANQGAAMERARVSDSGPVCVMNDERIRLKLKGAGYTRTVTAIHLKLKRMKFKHDGSFYSAYSLAQALGIDSHAVTRWIKSGHLKAKFRGTARGPQQNGDTYLIQQKDVRCFILEHPTDIDLRKVDQLWFMDVSAPWLARRKR